MASRAPESSCPGNMQVWQGNHRCPEIAVPNFVVTFRTARLTLQTRKLWCRDRPSRSKRLRAFLFILFILFFFFRFFSLFSVFFW